MTRKYVKKVDQLKDYVDNKFKDFNESFIEQLSAIENKFITLDNTVLELSKRDRVNIVDETIPQLSASPIVTQLGEIAHAINKLTISTLTSQEKPQEITAKLPTQSVTYHVGQKFKFINSDSFYCLGHTFLLTAVPNGNGKDNMLLVNIEDGEYWTGKDESGNSCTQTVFDEDNITEEEFCGICAGNPEYFELIEE